MPSSNNCPVGEEYNEILRRCEKVGLSKAEIYYWRNPKDTPSGKDWFDLTNFEGITPEHRFPTKHEVKRDYALLGKLPMTGMEEIFMFMQGEVWSPRGEAKPLIRSKGLRHTSMSVGDVICFPDKNKCYAVDDIGFIELIP